MRGRWLTGWNLTGVLVAPVMSHAMNATPAAALFLFIVGASLAVVVGARVSARSAERIPAIDGSIGAGAYLTSAAVFLGLVFRPPADRVKDFPQFFIYAVVSLLMFGFLFGGGLGKYYRLPRPLAIALVIAPLSLLAGFLIFILSYLLAGGNFLVVYGIVPMRWKVPIGLVLSGFLGSLLPGMLVETLLSSADESAHRDGTRYRSTLQRAHHSD